MKTSTLTFKQFNDEINDFYKHLKDNKYKDDDIKKLFSPYITPNSKLIQSKLIFASIIIATLLYFATYVETISWHFSALARIFLIKLLPLWNWPALKNQRCLIEKPSPTTPDSTFNCDLCENIDKIDVYADISSSLLQKHYLDLDHPLIVEKSWPKIPDFIPRLIANEEIAASKPCRLVSNIHNGLPTVKTLLSQTELFDSFFLHFQNCDYRAMKQFRAFAPRLKFVPAELSPVQYNWLVWSRKVNVTRFKAVGLEERVAVMGQIEGANRLKLKPRRNCEEECPVVEVVLREGEAIVVTSLWDLEYRPESGENVAVIIEMH